MRRIAEFVLRHRKWVVAAWAVILFAGIALAQTTNNRLVVDFSLPGQPGTQTANQIDREFQAGGKTQPYVLTITLPSGQTVAANRAEVAKAFAAVQQNVPDIQIVDEANTGDTAFRTHDGRTAYALAFYRFLHDPTAKLPTDAIKAALSKAA